MPFISSTRGTFGAQGKLSAAAALNYFGTGADGSAVISTNTSLTVLNKSGAYDGDMVVRNYSSLTINSGATLTTDQPCRGSSNHRRACTCGWCSCGLWCRTKLLPPGDGSLLRLRARRC